MLSAVTPRAAEIAGTAVFKIVVSSASMKKATATSHGSSRLLAAEGNCEGFGELTGPIGRTGLMDYALWIAQAGICRSLE